jgi:hypothetical protein
MHFYVLERLVAVILAYLATKLGGRYKGLKELNLSLVTQKESRSLAPILNVNKLATLNLIL